MLRLSAVVLLLYIATAVLHAGEPVFVPHGADKTATAFATVASPDHWGSFHNQALMTRYNDFTAGLSFESRFMVAAMASKALTLIIPGHNAPLGVVVSHFGNRQYSSLFAGLSSAISISDDLSFGLQVDFIRQTGIGDYADASHITFEAGLAASITSELTAGIHVFNPLHSVNNLPSSVRAGVAWLPASGIILSFEASKVTEEPLSLHAGMSWMVREKTVLRAGYLSSPSSFAFGAGFLFSRMQTDIGFLVNNRTGVTSSISLILKIGKHEK